MLLLPSTETQSEAGSCASNPPIATTAPKKKPAAGGRKRKASAQPDAEMEGEEGDESAVCIPAHRLVLMAKSTYFNTRLNTAVGAGTTSVIREHASSMDEVRAMEAVVEFMYTDILPLLSSSGGAPSVRDGESSMSDLQRLLLTLAVSAGCEPSHQSVLG